MAATKTTGTQKRRFVNQMATAFKASGATVNSGAAAVVLIDAVANKRHWITRVNIVNKTAGEYPVCELTEDPAGTPVIRATMVPHSPGGSAGMGNAHREFDPPLEVGSGLAFGWQHQSAVGDTYADCEGYVEDNATPS